MFSLYKHKQQILLSVSDYPLKSRYVIPYYPQKLEKDALQITYRNRHLKIKGSIQGQWMALISDVGLQLKYLSEDFETEFILKNEEPILLLLAQDQHTIFYYPLSFQATKKCPD